MDLYHIIKYGLILSLIASSIIFISLYVNPRMWLQDYPKDIQQRVEPKTKEEKRQSLFWAVPLILALFIIPFLSAWTLRNEVHSFLSLFLTAFGVAMFFNLFDLLVIDYLICCVWTPKFLILPGTEGMTGYKDYGHHFKGFIVGTILSVFVGLLIALAVLLLK
jgi:hypothetical protein